ncbi:mitochondrial carrier domain-containing protein [Lipomyces japonicus]|uniref:mitochondrial carrier domain-containing protein n=1 Tax=Lipomyces japonicus TaxID=56871 RepID=UPI0034CECEF6
MSDRKLGDSEKIREDRVRKLFHSLDTKNVGYLDKDSLKEGFHKIGHPLENADGIVSQVVSLVDKNGDGVIQFDEFREFVVTTEARLREMFNIIDKDHNGRLDKAEVAHALEISGLTVSNEKLKQFFQTMDKDNDGTISFDDWRYFLLFLPVDNITIKAAYRFFLKSFPLNSEGDVLISDDTLTGIGYFIAGGAAGVVSRTATAPFDRLKVFLIAQTGEISKDVAKSASSSAVNVTVKKFSSPLWDAIKTIWRSGGAKSFFVGNGLNVLKVLPESAIKFGSFEAAKKFLAQLEGTTVNEMSSVSSFLAGGIGGVISQLSVYPVDTLKFRIQCEVEYSSLRGRALLRKTAIQMWKDGGLSTYYRGLLLGIGGIFPYAALDMGTFTVMKQGYIKAKALQSKIDESEVKIGNMLVLSMGAISGSIGATAVYPVNLVRTRLQAQGTAAHPQTYTGWYDVLHKTIKHEGVKGLFRGLVPNLAKVAPAVSISYVIYENCKSLMGLE